MSSPLDPARASAFAQLALKGIDREYPNKPAEVLRGPADIMSPAAMHPAFYGCFDWHSAVHGHWLLVRLLRVCPALPEAATIRARLSAHLTAANLATEAAYFEPKDNRGFERMYGWAWALRLAAELRAWDDPDARRWAANLVPLEQRLVGLTRGAGDRTLEKLITTRAREYYLADRNYPNGYEPSGEDFFSAGLNVADTMRRVLSAAEFSAWLKGFIPGLSAGDLGNWGRAAEVTDPTDGRLIHLAGLNLNRAWTLSGVHSALPPGDARATTLDAAIRVHEEAGLRYVFSGHYEGEHWLATFAVYHLTRAGLPV